jgi:hypothetical protein
MQKSNQRLNTFISEITSGDASPIATSAKLVEERVWSGEIAEVDQRTYGFYMKGNAGEPKMLMDDWFLFSDARIVTQPGVLFWKNGGRFYARRLDQQEWDKLLKAAKVTRKFW